MAMGYPASQYHTKLILQEEGSTGEAMAPPSRATVALFFLYATGVVLLSGAPPARSQQPYGSQIADCGNKHNDTGLLGYFCGSGAPSSCESYLTFHARTPFSDPASIAALLGADAASLAAANSAPSTASPFAQGTKVLVPLTCSCTAAAGLGGSFFQRNATYVARDGDTLFIIANNTFQGLSTCQAVEEQGLGGAAPTSLLAGQSITVPLRCACPSASQAAAGVRFLVSYLVDEFDGVDAVATRFGVDAGSIVAANQIKIDSTIYPYTTLLIPVKSQPDIAQLQSPPPPPPPPPPVASVPATKSRSHAGVYIGTGEAVAAVAVIASVVAALILKARRRRRASTILTTAGVFADKDGKGTGKPPYGAGDEVSVTISEAFSSSLSDIKSSLKVYTYEELVTATDHFSTDRRIGGSVYRAAFSGDIAAVEIVDHDVSTEVEITRRMNHFNLVRLNGLCHHRGRWYLVSEYAEHGTLRDRLLAGATGAAAALSWTQRVQVALDVAEGLRYLHGYARPPYVHMDVRSGSVLLDAAFRAKIRNFGGARVIRGEQDDGRELFTMTSTITGARGYMAPEYLEHGVVSPKADVYSLGVVLLELVTGKDVEDLEEDGRGDPLSCLNALGVDRKNDGAHDGDDGAALKRLEEFVDPAMAAGSCPLDAVVMMVRLIERCVRRDAAARPGTGEVAQYLMKLSDISGDSWQSSSEFHQSSGSETTSQQIGR